MNKLVNKNVKPVILNKILKLTWGGTCQGQVTPCPGKRLKSNWQQTFGSGPQVCGTSYE